jgi:hypothetical protein
LPREATTADQAKRDRLFPVILGILLAGSVISFALAYVGQVVPHQEVKSSAEHIRISPSAPGDKVREAAPYPMTPRDLPPR